MGIWRKAAAALGFVDDEYFAPEPEEEPEPEEIGGGGGGNVYHLPTSRTGARAMAIVRARPRTMEDSAAIADKIKERLPVAINLEDVDETVARRLVDFISGVTYALDGSMKKIGRAVFLCSPHDLPIEELEPAQRRAESLFDEAAPAAARPSFL